MFCEVKESSIIFHRKKYIGTDCAFVTFENRLRKYRKRLTSVRQYMIFSQKKHLCLGSVHYKYVKKTGM